jgi:hypothetical protein
MGLDTKTDWLTDWPTDRQSQCDFDFDGLVSSCRELSRVLEMAVEGDENKWQKINYTVKK